MCKKCECNDDPYAVFKQALKEGKRVQMRRTEGEEWFVGHGNQYVWANPASNYRIHPDDVDKPKGSPHKHATLIKAWADGAKIQGRNYKDEWVDIGIDGAAILWSLKSDYRIKPTPKPDIVFETCLIKHQVSPYDFLTINYMAIPNCRTIFDGETGKLKSVEMIK